MYLVRSTHPDLLDKNLVKIKMINNNYFRTPSFKCTSIIYY